MFDHLNERSRGVVLEKIKVIALKIKKIDKNRLKNDKNRPKSKKKNNGKMGSKNDFFFKLLKILKKLKEIDVFINFHENICNFHHFRAFLICLILLRNIPRNRHNSMGGSVKQAENFQIH